MKLFCLPYAGGNADFYKDIKEYIENKDTRIEVIALEYPGHGSRRKENLLSTFDDLSSDVIKQMAMKFDEDDYALMGYSMGSIVASEVVRKILLGELLSKPKKIFLAAHEPRTIKMYTSLSNTIDDAAVKKRTIDFGAVPESLINNETFWRIYLPLFKADYNMILNYNFGNLSLKTNIDTTIFYSEIDTPYEIMKEWSKYYCGNLEYFQFDGNHFFLKNHFIEIGNIIINRLDEVI